MTRPIIGIIGKVQPQYEEDIWHRIDEVDEIRYLIVKNGGTAIMLLPTQATLKFNDNDHNSNEQIQEQMRSFINELCQRRRDDPKEEGLQAGMLIMPSAFASKITENDGKDPHEITSINLLRYIKEKKDFYLREAGQWFNLLRNEKNEIYENGIDNRITDSEDRLMMAIQSNSNIQTKFQLTVLKALIDELWRIKQNGLYKSVEVGFYSPVSKVDVEELNDELYSKLNKSLEEEKTNERELER